MLHMADYGLMVAVSNLISLYSILHASLPSPLLPIRMSAGSSPSVDSPRPPFQRGSTSDVEWPLHNYTNVEFAIENAHGKAGRCVSPRKRNPERSLLQHIHAREQIRYGLIAGLCPVCTKRMLHSWYMYQEIVLNNELMFACLQMTYKILTTPP